MLQKAFDEYLISLGISTKSFKNYRSDVSHFFSWAKSHLNEIGTYIESFDEIAPFLGQKFISEYKSYLASIPSPVKSINRRLSTLRHLSHFLVATQITSLDFMEGIQNVSSTQSKRRSTLPLLDNYRTHLESQKVSSNTVKNYLSDIRQFLAWLESNNAHSV